MKVNIYIESHGCTANQSEGEIMAGILEKEEYKIVATPEDAYVIIVNVCTVKGDHAAVKHVKDLKTKFPDKIFVVAGCITSKVITEVGKFEPNACYISTHNIKNIVTIIEEAMNKTSLVMAAFSNEVKINLPRLRKNKLIAIIPISSGCTGTCTYCSVKQIKGDVFSYPMEDILAEASKAIFQGSKELWITSQDNAAYMLDKKENDEHNKEQKSKLPELLKQIIAIPGDFKIRLGMMNPNNLIPILDDILKVYKSEKMFKFIHIPVQSGNDYVLEKMNRKYTTDQFRQIVKTVREHFSDMTIATDVIVGFPGESRLFFSNTVDIVKQIMPDALNISKFRPRPGTPAADMENKVDGLETHNRSTLISSIFNNIAYMRNESWYGWKGKALVDEKNPDGTWTARNYAYKPIILEGEFEMGQEVNVMIKKITTFGLIAEPKKPPISL
jgi:threonylcarbamoyladenosine tRNA methylthiotransferase CDKAL1